MEVVFLTGNFEDASGENDGGNGESDGEAPPDSDGAEVSLGGDEPAEGDSKKPV